MKVLVTGGAGFIGSHLVAALVRAGNAVTVLDNLRRGRKEALANCSGHFTFIEGDVRDPGTVSAAIRGAATVFHLAAQSSVMTADVDGDYTRSTNVEGTRNILEAAEKEGVVRRVVFTSSREVYGDPAELPVPETARLNPKNTYGISKMHGEALCREFSTGVTGVHGTAAPDKGFRTPILRLANVYGAGDRDRVLPIFLDNALEGRPLRLYGGQQIIDFVWIDVVVNALVQVGLGSESETFLDDLDGLDEPINIGSGKGTTVAELARRVVEATGSRSPIEVKPAREIEVSRFVADIGKARLVLGIEPPVDPLFKLAEMVQSVRAVIG